MISAITIENFRNHRRCEIDDISSLFAITGENGSGKSNVLRALNLFFNNKIELDEEVDIWRDFNGTATKRKKAIRISCKFELPEEFRFRNSIQDSAEKMGLTNKSFWLLRIWELDRTNSYTMDRFEYRIDDSKKWKQIPNDERSIIDIFLNGLIHFRYIPNHLHPVEIIRREERPLQNALLAKIRRIRDPERAVDLERQLEPMVAEGQKLIEPIRREITKASGLSDMTISPPTDWTQVALSIDMNLQTKEDDQLRGVNLHGSGHQSLLALNLLHLLDTRFSEAFGWHQATIWALEEPESFLHQELCLQVGDMLGRFAQSPRFQIFATTHSPLIMTSCINGCVVNSSSPIGVLSPRELIEQAARTGASPFLHPLLFGGSKPLLLVEGISDKMYIDDAYRKHGRVNPWNIQEVKEINNKCGSSGLDDIVNNHVFVFQGRPLASPIVLLYDHGEKRNDINKKDKKLKEYHKNSMAIQWSGSESNKALNPRYFTGIEVFLSTDFLEKASENVPFSLHYPNRGGPISIEKQEFGKVKTHLAKYAEEYASKEDYELLMKQIEHMEKRVGLC